MISSMETITADKLPDKNVLFIGGHENEIAKLKLRHPEWTFLGAKERNSNKVKRDFDFVVAKVDHVSHNIIERALAFIPDDVPVIYSNVTNIDRMEHEILTQIEHVQGRGSA